MAEAEWITIGVIVLLGLIGAGAVARWITWKKKQ